MSIGRGTLGSSDQQIALLQQQVADLQKGLALAQQNVTTLQQLTDTWAVKLSAVTKTPLPVLRSIGGATAGKLIIQG